MFDFVEDLEAVSLKAPTAIRLHRELALEELGMAHNISKIEVDNALNLVFGQSETRGNFIVVETCHGDHLTMIMMPE